MGSMALRRPYCHSHRETLIASQGSFLHKQILPRTLVPDLGAVSHSIVCHSLQAPSQLGDEVRPPSNPAKTPEPSPPPNASASYQDQDEEPLDPGPPSSTSSTPHSPSPTSPSPRSALSSAADWHQLQLALVSLGTADALTVDDVVISLQRAAQLAAEQRRTVKVGPQAVNERLLARAVVTLCCLILLRDLDQLNMVTVSGTLGALGLLAAHGILPPITSRDAPREVLVAAAHLSHRARMAGASGRLGPNQLAHALRGSALLAPQMLGEDWLQEAEQQLGREVMAALAPASVAALMTAFTTARQGRGRRWTPSGTWVMDLQEIIAPRLEEFSGFEVAATLYGLVDLTTTTSTPFTPPPPPAEGSHPAAPRQMSSSDVPPPTPGGLPFTMSMNKQQAIAARTEFIKSEQRRVEGLWMTRGGRTANNNTQTGGAAGNNSSTGQPQGPLHPELLERVRGWEKAWATSHQWQQQQQQVDATATAMATATAVVDPPDASTNIPTDTSSTAVSALLSQALTSVDIPPTPVFTQCVCGVQVRHLSPSDLALMLVSYTRLGLKEFTPARPREVGMLPFEVVAAEKQMGVEPSYDDEDDDEDEEGR